jgi:environmental stress-induced protein Ves
MPWKNGKGETVEIAVFPAHASVDTFDWRISTATVAEDGPFSHFAGIDRTLSILTGQGMMLSVEGRDNILLQQSSDPYVFPGDVDTTAVLTGGAITDLNVMTRRGRFVHHVTRLVVEGSLGIAPRAEMTIAIVKATARLGNQLLGAMDAAVLNPAEGPATLYVEKETVVFLVEIMPA